MRSSDARGLLWLALVSLCMLTPGCGGSDRQTGSDAAPIEAAVVPGASLLLRVDVQAWNEAPIAATLRDERPNQPPTDALGDRSGLDGKRFAEITGLQATDVVAMLFSADLGPVDPQAGVDTATMAKVPAAAGTTLARPLPLDTLERALRESIRRDPALALGQLDVAETPALEIRWGTSPAERLLVAAVDDARTLLASTNAETLAGVLERAQSRRAAPPAPDVERLRATLSPGGQHELVLVLPERLRAALRAQPAGSEQIAALVEPLRGLFGVALGMEATDELAVLLVADVGEEATAQEVVHLLQGWAPVVHMFMAGATGNMPGEMADRLQMSSEGSVVRVRLRVTARDAIAYRGTAAKKAAAALQQS